MKPSTSRPARRSKYGNVRTIVDDISFASKAEAKRWCELKLLARAAEIYSLRRQTPFEIWIGATLVCTYVSDFDYHDSTGNMTHIVEDVKGVETEAFKIKWALVKALYPYIDFRLIARKRGVPLRASSGRVGERAVA